mgnify:CR=1 FL=1
MLVGVIVSVGLGFTVTVTVLAALTQPALDVAVIEYTVVVVGLATTLVPVVVDKFVFGLQLYVFLSVKDMLQLIILPTSPV